MSILDDEITVIVINETTELGFGFPVKGDTGDAGTTGADGIQGIQGDQGIQGIKGDQGLQGIKGDQGTQGDQGIQGIKGDQGIQGPTGDVTNVSEEEFMLTKAVEKDVIEDSPGAGDITIYKGTAVAQTLTSAASWLVSRETFTVDGDLFDSSKKFASGAEDQIWDNRLSLTYT